MSTGKSKADFPGAYIPFDKPVGQVPTVAIDSAPLTQICINETWLPYLVTCLKALSRPETWDDSYDNAVIAASEFAALIGNIQDGCGATVPDKMCISGSFLDLDYGFEAAPGYGCSSVWEHGVGWEHCLDTDGHGINSIKREFGGDTTIREVHVTIDVVVPYLVDYDVTLYHSGTFTSVASDTAVTGPIIQVDVTDLLEVASALFIFVRDTFVGDSADIIISAWGLCYTGLFPLAQPPTSFFSHTFDFLTTNGGWVALDSQTTWTSGIGWRASYAAFGSDVFMKREFAERQILTFSITYDMTDTGGFNRVSNLHLYLASTEVFFFTHTSVDGSDQVDSHSLGAVLDKLVVDYNGGTLHSSSLVTVKSVTVTGVGVDPF